MPSTLAVRPRLCRLRSMKATECKMCPGREDDRFENNENYIQIRSCVEYSGNEFDMQFGEMVTALVRGERGGGRERERERERE